MMKIWRLKFRAKSQKTNDGIISANLVVTILAFFLIFFLTVFFADLRQQIAGFVVITLIYCGIIWLLGRNQTALELHERSNETGISDLEPLFDDEVENKLQAIEDASQFFSASLNASDMFRLVSSRVNEMIPFATCMLFIAAEDHARLKIIFSAGNFAEAVLNIEILSSEGLAGKSFTREKCILDSTAFEDKSIFSKEFISAYPSAIAAPLYREESPFGVLQLISSMDEVFRESSLILLEAISERLSPLILNSLAFEKNVSSALTDKLTDLPNERAFYLVLENQMAESQRNREKRPLTVLTLDIQNFTEINREFGHSTGDNVLVFAGKLIKSQLRQMDFLSRSSSDEFLIILPTASAETTGEIVERLDMVFSANPFRISDVNKVSVKLNIGFATFWEDGETPDTLLKNARRIKLQQKPPSKLNVISFPKN